MISIDTVRRAIEFGTRARSNCDHDSANRAFVGLLAQLSRTPVPGVRFDNLTDISLTPPYSNVLAISAGAGALRLERPLLAIAAFKGVSWRTCALPLHSRLVGTRVDLSAELALLDLPVPDGWLLTEDAPPAAWMTEAELALFCQSAKR